MTQSYFIDGVGDEVTLTFGILIAIVIVVASWLSTRVNDANHATNETDRTRQHADPSGVPNTDEAPSPNLDTTEVTPEDPNSPIESTSSVNEQQSGTGNLRQRHTQANASAFEQAAMPSLSSNATASSGGEPGSGAIKIRLKYMDESSSTVEANPNESLDSFRNRCLPVENQNRYRLIYRGQVLRDGTRTLRQLNLVINQVTLIAEDGEDMWHAYNILQPGDSLRSSTVRKVQSESNTGSSTSSRVRTTLTITVEAVDFDSKGCVLRVKGRNIVENQFVKMGAYHTLDLEPNKKFTLAKTCWDSVVLDRIDTACDPSQNSDVAAVVMQEGIAHVCLVLASMTLVRAKIEMHIPRKRKGSSQQHDKGVERFFESVMQAILRHVNFDVVKCVLIASPGFVKDQFHEYMFDYAAKMDNRLLIDNKPKFLLVHASSGFKHSLKEVLSDPAVAARLSDTKAAEEIRVLGQFYKMLQLEPDKAYYGEKEVFQASEAQAIDTLLVCDGLLRTHDVAKRKRLIAVVDSVRDNGGTVRVFSSMHITGEQLTQLTGIAAILRFPVPDLTDDESSDDDSS